MAEDKTRQFLVRVLTGVSLQESESVRSDNHKRNGGRLSFKVQFSIGKGKTVIFKLEFENLLSNCTDSKETSIRFQIILYQENRTVRSKDINGQS